MFDYEWSGIKHLVATAVTVWVGTGDSNSAWCTEHGGSAVTIVIEMSNSMQILGVSRLTCNWRRNFYNIRLGTSKIASKNEI